MKFCPQCGISLVPGDRFCQECGFDTSTVEPFEPADAPVPEAIVTETVTPPDTSAEIPASLAEGQPGCPQCGARLDIGDRFCPECGFDTSTFIPEVDISQPPQPDMPIEEVVAAEIPMEAPGMAQAKKQYCPECGSVIAPGDRFCQACGFDNSVDQLTGGSFINHDDQQGHLKIAEAEHAAPAFSPVPPAQPAPEPEPERVISPPIAEPVRAAASTYIPPARTRGPVTPKKSRKAWLWILLIVIGVGALGVAGWYGYNTYFALPEAVPADTTVIMTVPEIPVIDTNAVNASAADQQETDMEQQNDAITKPLSRADKDKAKQKAEKNKPAQQEPSPEQETRPDLGIKVIPNDAGNNQKTKVILEVGHKDDSKNKNPKNPTKLTIEKPTMIVRITTDHYNDGNGTSSAGNINIKDRDGNLIGSFTAYGKQGNNGAPNAKWVAEPHKVLEKGIYFIWDSDMPTWSKNFVGTGFVVVEGYEMQ